jgi:hypothetical protein
MFNQIPSRRERRALAKKLGLSGKKESLKQFTERTRRSAEFGKQLHLQHLQNQENHRINLESNLEEGKEQEQQTPTDSPNWGLEDFKQQIISGENPEA